MEAVELGLGKADFRLMQGIASYDSLESNHKEVTGTQHIYKRRMRKLGLFSLTKKSLKSDLITICNYLRELKELQNQMLFHGARQYRKAPTAINCSLRDQAQHQKKTNH